jgi:excisionase family DNA binding protein
MSLSLHEASALTGFSLTTLRRAVKREQLTVRRLGTRIIIRRVDLDAFLEALPKGFQTRKTG